MKLLKLEGLKFDTFSLVKLMLTLPTKIPC